METQNIRSVVILSPEGDVSETLLPEGEMAAMDTLRLLVGGPLEVLPLPSQKYLVINEDARQAPHFINQTATALAHSAETIAPDDYVAGTAVIVNTLILEQG